MWVLPAIEANPQAGGTVRQNQREAGRQGPSDGGSGWPFGQVVAGGKDSVKYSVKYSVNPADTLSFSVNPANTLSFSVNPSNTLSFSRKPNTLTYS